MPDLKLVNQRYECLDFVEIMSFLQVFRSWQKILSPEIGVALKSGLGLTYQQYEGIRYCLSHEFNDSRHCHERKCLPGTG